MKRLLLCAALAASATLLATPVQAVEYGRVSSVRPVIEQVPGPCGPTASFNETVPCNPPPPAQSRVAGYQISYVYKGQTYTAQVPSNPGSTVPLQFDPATGSPLPALANDPAPPPDAYGAAPPVAQYGYAAPYPAPAPVAVPYGQPYYDPYYAPAYYGPAVYGPPVVGVGIGLGFGGGWHGGGGGWHRH